MRFHHFASCVLTVSLLGLGCSEKRGGPPAPPVAPAPAKIEPVPAGVACPESSTRCQDVYVGTVKKGNNAPAGANAMECKQGKWMLKEACNASANIGCYMIDDPASGSTQARCVSAHAAGE